MGSFTVPTEICQAQFLWTGVQNLFPCGFPALDATNLLIQYTTTAVPPVTTTLVPGVHVAVLLDAISGNVSLTPLAMPAPNGTITVTRQTPATQPTQFSNLETYQADSITVALDRAEMGIAECKRRITTLEGATTLQPANFTFASRGQRSVTSNQQLPIQLLDSILNINVAAQLAVTVPLASTRAGAPLTFKVLKASPAGAVFTPSGADLFDGLGQLNLAPGQSITLMPYNDGINAGYAIE